MANFDSRQHIEGCDAILLPDGTWPSFHDAIVNSVSLWRGDIRPDDEVWIGPVIDVSLELAWLDFPFMVDFRFHDCDQIKLFNFNHENMIFSLTSSLEESGYFRDGITPLPPYIHVDFSNGDAASLLLFRCFRAQVLARRPVSQALSR